MAWPYDDDLTDPITQLYGGKLQPLPPDQTRSMLSRIGGGLTGGLAEIGDLADKFYGGRAIRGLLGGHARELLSVLPGSDTLGITDEQEKTTGRQLLDQYGLTKPKKEGDSGFDLNDALGIAAEIGLSPGSLPGKLGSLVPRTVFGGLNAAAKPAGLGVKALTGINPYTTAKFAMDEAGRVGGALFDKSTGGTWGKNVQNVARSTYSPELAAGREAASQADAAFRSPLDEISKRFADPREAAGVLQKEGQRWVEGDPTTARSNLLDYGFNQGDIQTVIPHIERYTSEQAKGQLGRELAVGKESAERSGLSEAQAARRDAIRQQDPNAPLPFELQAQQTYIPRTALGQDIEGGVRTSPTGINRANQFQKQAENLYKGVPGGAPTINEMFMNPSLAGKERGFADEDVKSKLSKMIYGEEYGDMPGHWAPKPTGNPNVDASLSMQASGNWQKAMSHVDQLSERLKNATAPEMERGIFSNDLAGNILARNYASAHQVAGGKAVLHALDKNSGIMDKAVTLESKGIPYVKVPDFLDSMHMSQQDANGTPIAMQKIAESLGLQPADAAALKTQLHEYAIPQDVANDISRMGVAWKNNSVLQPVLDAYSGYMQNLKANLTFPFPSFSARNLMQGVFDMWRGESLNTESGKSMSQMLRGGSLTEDAARKLHPDLFVPSTTIEGAELPVDVQKAIQEASVKTRNEMMASKMAWSQNNQASEKVGSVVRGARDIGALPEVGGEAMPWSEVVGNFAKGYVPEKQSLSDALKSPLDSETFIPTRQGQKLGNATEDWIRGSHYLGARMKGLEHGDAVMETMKYQRDYNNLSEFEKNVMKKLFPFYTFTRRNLPPILEDLVNKPAKLTGAIRASTSQEDNAYVPQYPGEGTAINVGQTPEGKTRFLSSTGLSYEDEAMKALGNLASGNVSRALQNVGGQLTPLLKAPIEQMTNTQLMTGKNLSDVKANLAGNLAQGLPEELGLGEPSTRFASAVSQIAGGTPLSRYVTTASKLADPRTQSAAGLANLASGLNFTDVDVPQQQQIAVRDKIIDAMRGTSGVQTWPEMNVPQDKLASLSPGQLEMYRFFKGLEQKGKADSKARKARKDLLSPLED